MTYADGDEHAPARPSWDCRRCERPWPCDRGRAALAAEMDRVSLAIYMWLNLEDAVRDMRGGRPADLYARFIEWTY